MIPINNRHMNGAESPTFPLKNLVVGKEGISTEGITGNAGTSLFQVISNAGSTSGEGITGELRFYSPASTTVFKKFMGDFCSITDAAVVIRSTFAASHKAITAYDGIQFFFGVSTIASGVFRLYGIKNT